MRFIFQVKGVPQKNRTKGEGEIIKEIKERDFPELSRLKSTLSVQHYE